MKIFKSIILKISHFCLIAVIVIFAGCSGSNKALNIADDAQPGTNVSDKKDTSHLEELFWKRLDESRMSFVQANADFMSGMIVHHAQAIVMSQLVPERTDNRTIQTLAARIINAQNDEIATMQKWLRDRRQPLPIISIDGVILTVETELPPRIAGQRDENRPHGHSDSAEHDLDDHLSMPGMLSQVQLNHLETLRGSDFEQTFLEFMISHHEGAVIMVDELFAADGSGNDEESYRLAVEIYAEQKTEIEMMKQMLEEYADRNSSSE